jgi:hypothetical protein
MRSETRCQRDQGSHLADFAKIVGRVPLQRLGAGMLYPNVHEVFHFVMGANDIQDWRSRRAVEAVFYFHPNAKVIVHLKETSPLDLGNLGIRKQIVATRLSIIVYPSHQYEVRAATYCVVPSYD